MTAPATLAEAQAQCRAAGVDTRVSGKGLTACMDLLAPFCQFGVDSQGPDGIPRCSQAAPDARKAAILLAEAEARANANKGSPWLLIAGGVALVGGLVYLATR